MNDSKDTNYSINIKNTFKKYDFTVYKPAGNDTGIIRELIHDSAKRKEIADAIQSKYSHIEQVGFINPDPANAELLMTGGEFCGNATRSAAHHILKGMPGEISIKVSGTQNKLRAGVTKDGQAFSQMPIYSDKSCIVLDPKYPYNMTVHMQGISHYIDFNSSRMKCLSTEEIKYQARLRMTAKGIDKYPACGIVYVEKKERHWKIFPIVYVREADTLFFESACGSATTALGMILAQKQGSSIRNIPIHQPSGKDISISVDFSGNKFRYAQIQSPIEKLYEARINLELAAANSSYLSSFSWYEKNKFLPTLPSKLLQLTK